MATDGKTRSNKQSTISFTLPLSCQICLGKVKQPVLCPNHHVFCQLCMHIWLEKNKQCPTCRVDINDENPVKQVIGGQLEEEDNSKVSTAEIRRVRFELLYREYEDQFEQMKKELIILRTENNILAAQLKDAEDENEGHRKAENKEVAASSSKDGPNLLVLTQNLQEAQKLYTGIKEQMTNLKQENGKLKDENINLTRENETLRLEIAQRSPKKFGRYTVATLETKVSELEKENRQLKNALHRSDTYVEDLEKQITKISNARQVNHASEKESISTEFTRASDNVQQTARHMETESSSLGQINGFVSSSNSVKRVLFDANLPPQSSNGHSFNEPSNSHIFTKDGQFDRVNEIREEQITTNNDSDGKSQKHPESIMKNSAVPSSYKNSESDSRERQSKKVKFDIQEEHNVSSSFDLEMPSPYHDSMEPDSPRTCQKVGKSTNNEKANFPTACSESNKRKVAGTQPSSIFDDYITNLLEKSNASSYKNNKNNTNNLSENGLGISQLKHDISIRGHSKVSSSVNNDFPSHDTGDSSHLSVPDSNSPDKINGLSVKEQSLSGLQRRSKVDTADLNISMTPELSDCLQLMTQAERKLEQTPLDSQQLHPDRDVHVMKCTEEDFSHLHLSKQAPPPSSVPYSMSMYSSLKPRVPSPSFQSYIPAADVSWKQKFFSTLSSNPYKLNPSSTMNAMSQSQASSSLNILAQSKSLSASESNLSTKLSMHDKDNLLFRDSIDSQARPPSRGPVHDLDSRFMSKSEANSNLYRPAFSSSISVPTASSGTNLTGDGSKRMFSHSYKSHANTHKSTFSSDQNLFSFPSADVNIPVRQPPPPPPQPSSSASSLPYSSLLSLPQSAPSGLSSSSSLHAHIEPVSSHSSYPSSSLPFSNPLPPSLNNSALEWPDDSPGLSMSRPDGVGFKLESNSLASSSSDTLLIPFKDRAGGASLRSGAFNMRNGKNNHVNNSYISSSLVSDDNSFQLPEPKKRLFNNSEDDLELPSSPIKTTKR